MSWMTLSGFPVPTLRGSLSQSDNPAGDQSEAVDGSVVRTRWAERGRWPARTTLLTRDDSNRFFRLIKGHGEVWLWNASTLQFSSRGNGPTATATVTTSGGKYTNTGFLAAGSGATVILNVSAPSSAKWWVSVWRFETAAVDGLLGGIAVGVDGWHLYDVFGNGDFTTAAQVQSLKVWRDGVRTTGSNIDKWMSFATTLRLLGVSSAGSNAAKNYSQLIVRPFWGLNAWPAIAAARTVEEALLPELRLGGDCLLDALGGDKVVLSSGLRISPEKANKGTRDDPTVREFNARAIEFTLDQSRPDSP